MDGPADVSSENRPGWYLLDGCVATRNRKVEGSNPSSGSICPAEELSSRTSTFRLDQVVAT